jgi:hypothetical protein
MDDLAGCAGVSIFSSCDKRKKAALRRYRAGAAFVS